ncbi:MAG: plastocyanin/azurin family copper-binding protein [Actinomycetota bacterium]
MKRTKVTLVPLVVAVAAFFAVLPRGGGDAVIRMVAEGDGFAFDPSELTVGPGARIRVENDTTATHSFQTGSGIVDLGDIQPGQTLFFEVADSGTLDFFCRYHTSEGMNGQLTVS